MSGITAGTVFHLNDMISIRPNQIASRALTCTELGTTSAARTEWVLYAMDNGETISSETAPGTKILHVLEGGLDVVVADQPCHLTAGASLIIPPDTWHEFAAQSGCKFLQITI